MVNVKISDFSFWQPVAFETQIPTTNSFSDYLWKIGSWADQFAYLGSSQISVKPEQINIRKFSFEENHEEAIAMRETGIKVAFYVLTLFTLPLIALAIKVIFKWRLNAVTMLKENPNTYLAGREFGKTRVVLVSGSLLDETTDAVVNAANSALKAGGGICGAFRKEAGQGIFDECAEILKEQKRKEIDTGEAVLTTAGDLAPRIKAIVHAVGPIYNDKKAKVDGYNEEQADLLAKAYTSSLELVTEPLFHQASISQKLGLPSAMRTIGFPSISTGIYDFPLDLAAETSLQAVKTYIEKHSGELDEVRFVFLPLDKDKQSTAQFYLDALKKL